VAAPFTFAIAAWSDPRARNPTLEDRRQVAAEFCAPATTTVSNSPGAELIKTNCIGKGSAASCATDPEKCVAMRAQCGQFDRGSARRSAGRRPRVA
jgi:hypothetical protein